MVEARQIIGRLGDASCGEARHCKAVKSCRSQARLCAAALGSARRGAERHGSHSPAWHSRADRSMALHGAVEQSKAVESGRSDVVWRMTKSGEVGRCIARRGSQVTARHGIPGRSTERHANARQSMRVLSRHGLAMHGESSRCRFRRSQAR